jgi:hypothetical protein
MVDTWILLARMRSVRPVAVAAAGMSRETVLVNGAPVSGGLSPAQTLIDASPMAHRPSRSVPGA